MRPDTDTLTRLYIDERETIGTIATKFSVGYRVARGWLDEAGIKRRVYGQAAHERGEARRPPRDTLVRMYDSERMTTGEIAQCFEVSRSHVGRWLDHYGIKRRPAGVGLRYRGVDEPTADDLARLVHIEHRSYREIGAMFSVDPSAVKHWLDRHNIARPTVWETRYKHDAPTIPPVSQLAALYAEGHSLEDIGARFGVTALPITRRLKAAGISIRRDGFSKGRRLACSDGHNVRSSYERRVDDWLFEHGIEHTNEPRLPWDLRWSADFLANGWYIEVWGITNDPTYTARRMRKQGSYREHGAPLIGINRNDFRRRKWEEKLSVIIDPSHS